MESGRASERKARQLMTQRGPRSASIVNGCGVTIKSAACQATI